MTVRARLVGTFAVVVALLAIPALFAAARLADLRDIAVEERGRHARAALTLGRMEATAAELEDASRTYLIEPNEPRRRNVEAALDRLDMQLDTLRATRYAESSSLIRPTVEGLREVSVEMIRLAEAGQLEAAGDDEFARMQTLLQGMSDGLTALADSVDAIAQRDFDRAEAISGSSLRATIFGMSAAVVLAVLLGAWTTGALTRPVRRLAQVTGQVAEGTFEAPRDLPYSRDDEIGMLARAFRIMTYRLSDFDRMKTEFISVASHELKNPVHVIRGYAELLEEEIPGELNPKQKEMVGAVAEQTRIMARLLGRLMDIGRLESGTYELRISTVRVDELVDALVRSFGMLAEKKGVELVHEVKASAPESFDADVDLLREEVLGNLVSNAVKHTPEGGRITLTVRGRQSEVVFEVSDTGPGIPESERPRIFRKYYRVEKTGKEGAGLGLAVAREMVEAHGGRIELDQDAAPGATFRVVLPVGGGEVREPAIQSRRGR
ncbi:MAG: HAMP domain-containing sensor histidine kinase [Gemmatimonadota bacterium]|jgi:signal transduction histidine kinase